MASTLLQQLLAIYLLNGVATVKGGADTIAFDQLETARVLGGAGNDSIAIGMTTVQDLTFSNIEPSMVGNDTITFLSSKGDVFSTGGTGDRATNIAYGSGDVIVITTAA